MGIRSTKIGRWLHCEVVVSAISVLPVLFALGSAQPQSICERDDRLPADAAAVGVVRSTSGKIPEQFCTVTLVSDSCAVTAGHCLHVLERAYFQDPAGRMNSLAEDLSESSYRVNTASIHALQSRIGNDWAVFRLEPNEITGLLPGKVHGFVEIELQDKALPLGGLELTAYSRRENTFESLSSTGRVLFEDGTILFHDLDTSAGNSGALIFNSENRKAVAIHTHGGCNTMKNNKATIIARVPNLVKSLKSCIASERKSNF